MRRCVRSDTNMKIKVFCDVTACSLVESYWQTTRRHIPEGSIFLMPCLPSFSQVSAISVNANACKNSIKCSAKMFLFLSLLKSQFVPVSSKLCIMLSHLERNSILPSVSKHLHSHYTYTSFNLSIEKMEALFTLSRKEFIHFVKVFFCMASRSSCSALMRPCSNLMTSSLCVMAGA